MFRALTTLAAVGLSSLPAAALVGGASPAPDAIGRSVVVIVGSRGNSCSGAALARDLILTAAHCVRPGAEYKIVEYDSARQPRLHDIARIVTHPKFDAQAASKSRATADVALLKLAAPLSVATVPLYGSGFTVAPGDTFMVAGGGVAARNDGKSGGTVRAANLVATGRPGTLQIRLFDPATKGERPGLGACTGDSGGPVLAVNDGRAAVAGVVSWATGPKNTDGCGGLTGVTPVTLYREWIRSTAKILGNQL